MKIIDFRLNIQVSEAVSGDISPEYHFLFTKTPAIFSAGGSEQVLQSETVIIYDCGTEKYYRSPDKKKLTFDRIAFRMNSSDKQFFSDLKIPLNSPITLTESAVIRSLMRSMQLQQIYCGASVDDFNDYALRMIFINVSEQISKNNSSVIIDIPHYKELLKLRRQIYNSPEIRWNISEICSDMNISRTYFHRIYFYAFGVTCMQDVIESRLSSAGNMLVNTDYSISDIAERCGYDSDSYFMRQFKKHIGYTPSEYRSLFSGSDSI